MTNTSPSTTMADFASRVAGEFGERPAVRHKSGDEWIDISYRQLGDDVAQLAGGLIRLGVAPGDRVCILANTRPEWIAVALAISAAGGVVVPVYPTNSPEECAWVAGNSAAEVIVCGDATQAAKIAEVRSELPGIEHVVLIDEDESGSLTLDDLRSGGPAPSEELARRAALATPDSPHTIIYTSGTTGPPKGCVLSHRNLATCAELVPASGLVQSDDVAYLYLPLAHIFAILVQTGALAIGGCVAYYGGDIGKIVAELGEVRPTVLPSVPRIFEKIYALAAPTDGAPLDDERRAFVRGLFGGRMRVAITGAAPIAPDILEFFADCGVMVYEGYGLTETSGIATVNLPGATRYGTIGRAYPGLDLRIGHDGEILVKGPMVFTGYWGNSEATAEVIDDEGWFRTGDLGSVDADGFFSITGRKKEILITAGGKNLAPANLENDLKQSRFISQAVMYADRKPYPVILVTLDPEMVGPWAAQQGLPSDMAELIVTDEVRAMVQAEIDRVNAKYAAVEQVKKFAILDHDLTVDGGELTPSLKMKRRVVYEKYNDIFEGMYADGGRS